MSPQPDVIHIAAAVIRDPAGRLLLVRKHGTEVFMQAGGKIEPGEAPVQALIRELREELGADMCDADARFLGRFSAPAAHERDHVVLADLFEVTASGPFEPAAEIAELLWLDPENPGPVLLAPLTRDHVVGRMNIAG